MADLRHAGMGWPNGPVSGGNGRILRLPSAQLLMLTSEHWHHDQAVDAGKEVVVRAAARHGHRPAELKWDPNRYVAEILRDIRREPRTVNRPIKHFIPWNELNLQDERGDDRPDHGDLSALMFGINKFCVGVVSLLREALPGTQIHFGAWAPKDETDYLGIWRQAADACDVIDVHAYGNGVGILGHVEKYRALFPGKPIWLTEWHSDFDGPEKDRETLALMANYAAVNKEFRAYYFAWRWFDPPGHQRALAQAIQVEGRDEREDLFMEPPVATGQPAPPAPEPEPEKPVVNPNPYEHFTSKQIADAAKVPQKNVEDHWPGIVAQLHLWGINTKNIQIGSIGIISKETASTFDSVREGFFLPSDEARWAEYTRRGYEGGPKYHGRSYGQNTHLSEYRRLAQDIPRVWGADPNHPDFDFVGNPDKILEPDFGAAAFASFTANKRALPGPQYPQGYRLVEAMENRDWDWARKLWYGGDDPDGVKRMKEIDARLSGAAPPAPTPAPTPPQGVKFNPDYPVILQEETFDCSETALLWTLRAYGRNTSDDWLEAQMIAENAMTPDVGLRDATGTGLAAFINRHYGNPQAEGGDLGYRAVASGAFHVSFDEVASQAVGKFGVMIGGRKWYHWTAVQKYDAARDVLLLANSAPNHKVGGFPASGQMLTRDDFNQLGWWSMVTVDNIYNTAYPDEEPIPPAPGNGEQDETVVLKAKIAELESAYLDMKRQLDWSRTQLGELQATVAPALRRAHAEMGAALNSLETFRP